MRNHGLRTQERRDIVDGALNLSYVLGIYDEDELLSMGQSQLAYDDREGETSIFISTPERRGVEGERFRLLALYCVCDHYLGLDVEWLGEQREIKARSDAT